MGKGRAKILKRNRRQIHSGPKQSVEEFLAKGGKITRVPPPAEMEDPGPLARRFIRSRKKGW